MANDDFKLNAKIGVESTGDGEINKVAGQLQNFGDVVDTVKARVSQLNGDMDARWAQWAKESRGAAGAQDEFSASLMRSKDALRDLQSSFDYEQRVQEVGRLVASQERLAEATNIVKQAQKEYEGADSIQQQEAATKNLVQSMKDLQAAQRENAVAASQHNKTISGLQKEYNKQLQTTDKLLKADAYKQRVQEVGRLQAAEERLNGALKAREEAQERVNQVNASGDASLREMIEAQRELNKALTEHKAASSESAAAQKEWESSLIRSRYAMESLSRNSALLGATLLGAVAVPVKTFVEWESALAGVERTVLSNSRGLEDYEQRLASLNQGLIDVAKSAPIAFEDLARTATIAGQLDIAEENVVSFAKTVEMFAATTNVSVDTASTAFARLDSLSGDLGGNFENLANTVLDLGTNSKATEGELLNVAVQISALGAQAGLSADQTLALSTSLANVRIPPELARGSMQRVFGNIQKAVAHGGASLEEFGRISGMSADEFRRAWQEDAAGTLVDILRGIAAEGENSALALEKLGINSVRDLSVMQRLAQTVGDVEINFDRAADAITNTDTLMDHYGIVAGTVASQLLILKNNVQAMFYAFNDSEALAKTLGWLLGTAIRLVEGFTAIAQTSIGSFFINAGIGAAAFFGTLGLIAAALLRVRMAANSVITSYIEYGRQQDLLSLKGKGMITTLLASARQAGMTANQMRILTWTLRGLQAAFIATAAISTVIGLWAAFTNKTDETNQSLQGLESTFKRIDGVMQATEGTVRQVGDALAETGVLDLLDRLGVGYDGLAEDIAGVSESQEVYKQTTEALTAELESLEAQLVKIIEKYPDAFMSTREYIDVNDQIAEVKEALAELESQNEQSADAQDKAAKSARAQGDSYEELADGADDASRSLERYLGLQDELAGASIGDALVDFADNLTYYGNVWDAFTEGGAANLRALDSLIGAIVENADGNHAQIVANVQQIMNAMQASGIGTAETFQYLANVIAQFGGVAQNTASVMGPALSRMRETAQGGAGVLTEYGRAQQALAIATQGAARATFSAEQVQAALNRGVAAGTERLGSNSRAAGRNSKAKDANRAASDRLRKEIDALNEAIKAQDEILNRNIRTTSDYASDVSGIWQAAFDIVTGPSTQLIAIADGWDDIKDAARDAEQAIREANAEILGLKADRELLEYQLAVAEMYGDHLRASQIRAQLAENTNDLAEAQRDLTEAQKDSKRATGTEELVGMVGSYGELIEMYLAAGYQGKDLNKVIASTVKDFEKQAKAAGFNSTEIANMAKMLREFGTIAARVPDPEVTFKTRYGNRGYVTAREIGNAVANEIQSWAIPNREFLLSMGWRPPTGNSKSFAEYWNTQVRAFNEKNRLQAILSVKDNASKSLRGIANALGGIGNKNIRITEQGGQKALDMLWRIKTAADGIGRIPISVETGRSAGGRYSTGGAVRGMGTGTSDSIPAWLSNGEHVLTAREVQKLGGQSAVYGLRRMINSGEFRGFRSGGAVHPAQVRVPVQYTPNRVTSSSSGNVFELGPMSLNAIVNRAVQVIIDSKALANDVTKTNFTSNVLSGVG